MHGQFRAEDRVGAADFEWNFRKRLRAQRLQAAHLRFLDRQVACIQNQRSVRRTSRLPADVENHISLELLRLEVDGEIELELLDPNLLEIAVGMRVAFTRYAGPSFI